MLRNLRAFSLPTSLALGLFVLISAQAHQDVTANERMSKYMEKQIPYALEQILRNFVGAERIVFGAAQGSLPGLEGAIVAAPSLANDSLRGEVQDYRWRWKRDSAITMRFLVRVMNGGELEHLPSHVKLSLLKAYVEFCETEQFAHQRQKGRFDLGHAKATLMAQPNPRQWGYPQNDGPALEIIALEEVLRLGERLTGPNREWLATARRVWLRNLDYIIQSLHHPTVERWEEHKAQSHFSILVEMHEALRSTLRFLPQLVPPEVGNIEGRRQQIQTAMAYLENMIRERHLSPNGYILAYSNPLTEESLVRNKDSALDTQVLMTSVFTNKFWDMDGELFYPPSHPLMRATFQKLREAFASKYPVNIHGKDAATNERLRGLVFGRYPEDSQHFAGAPWFITTFAAVQYLLWDAIYIHRHGVTISLLDLGYFQALQTDLTPEELAPGHYLPTTKQSLQLRNGLIRLAKEIFFRSMVHVGEDDLSLSEVINPENGYKEGIQHLTWSYVEFVKSVRMLRRAQAEFGLKLDLRVPEAHCVRLLRAEPAG